MHEPTNSVADDKTEVGRRIEVIGYVIDLDIQRVLIAKKNYLRALHGFISINLAGKMTLRVAQRLASWASRYGKICRVMRPFCGALNRLMAGRVEVHASFFLSEESKIAIKCWQAMLCLVRYQEIRFTRTLQSFDPTLPSTIAEFDSSLTGTGLIWYDRVKGAEVARGVCAVDLSFLKFGDDSSYQNLSEFIGVVVAVLGHVILGNRGRSLALRGDSVSALTWAITERPRGSIVTNAAMVWTLLCIAADIDVREATHIPGAENDDCDQLSRRGPDPINAVEEHAKNLGIVGAAVVEAESDSDIMTILKLCDPNIRIQSDMEFMEFWSTARSAIDSFLDRNPAVHPTSTYLPSTI